MIVDGAADKPRVAIACQGGGSHTAFTAGVLKRLLPATAPTHEIVGISGTSGGAVCALLAWYALCQGDPPGAGRLLDGFWADNSASTPFAALVNASVLMAGELQRFMVMPAISPYGNALADTAAEEFKEMLRRQVNFDAPDPCSGESKPVLFVGAVDVLSGEFRVFDSRSDRISPATILASAAIPTLFRSVRLDGGTYWDGLFSQNPPISQLIDTRPDEIWVIQINPTARETEPTTVLEISDRRNELAGNLSLYQELHFVEKIDQLLEEGVLSPGAGYRTIMIRIIELTRARVPHSLGASSKLNRDPAFIRDLMAHGERQADEFLTALAFERGWRARDAPAVLSFLADPIAFRSSAPFPDWGPTHDPKQVAAFLEQHLGGLELDVTRKQLARERIVWTLRTLPDASGARARGQVEVTLRAGKIDALILGSP